MVWQHMATLPGQRYAHEYHVTWVWMIGGTNILNGFPNVMRLTRLKMQVRLFLGQWREPDLLGAD